MKINWINPASVVDGSEQVGAKNSASAKSASTQQADQAQISADFDRVSSLKAQALSAPEVRQEKIDALRQQVQSGQYKVDAGKVADALYAELAPGSQTK